MAYVAYAYVRRRLHRRESCICGHHIYKDMWNPLVGEVLQCEKDPHNAADRYSVAVKKRRSRRQTFTEKYQDCAHSSYGGRVQ